MPSVGVHAGQPARQADSALALEREGIVAAGVEDEDHGAGALRLQPVGQPAGRERGVAYQPFLPWGRDGNVDGEEIVGAVDGEAMPGEIDERCVAGPDLPLELDECAAHGAAAYVLRGDHLEAELGELLRNGVSVVRRLQELRHVLMGVIADDERDPVRRLCGLSGKE